MGTDLRDRLDCPGGVPSVAEAEVSLNGFTTQDDLAWTDAVRGLLSYILHADGRQSGDSKVAGGHAALRVSRPD